MSRLLARYAESVFWLARYVERAENLARILDVQNTYAREGRGSQDWGAVLAINADAERFAALHPAPTAQAVLRFYVLDRRNPTSIISNLQAARDNARVLRPLISIEMWAQLNTFYNRMAALGPSDLSEERVSRLCAVVKDGCETHAGTTAGTFYRDEAWSFYGLGAAIETADQTTRLLDVRLLGPAQPSVTGSAPAAASVPGDAPPDGDGNADGDVSGAAAVDASHWTALLRSAAAYQAFRRRHPRDMRAGEVAAFLLCDPGLPRSFAHCLGVMQDELERLRRTYGLRAAAASLAWLDEVQAGLDADRIRKVVATPSGIHELNDGLQQGLQRLTTLLGAAFFGYRLDPALERSTAAMTQRMGGTGGGDGDGMTQTMGGMSQTLKGGAGTTRPGGG